MSGVRTDIRDVTKGFGGPDNVLQSIAFSVSPGEIVAIVARSGAGKSTLLRMIAGLQRPDSGSIEIEGARVNGPLGHVGFLVQDYSHSLFPWLSVRRNLALAMHDQPSSPVERDQSIRSVLDKVKLAGIESMYPWQLSGGMQQRVALARALLRNPRLLLLDEPFASVDALVRFELEDLTANVIREANITTILVTHDIDEAIYMADRVLVLGHSPARVCASFDVGLSRPRNQLTTRNESAFGELRSQIFKSLESLSRH